MFPVGQELRRGLRGSCGFSQGCSQVLAGAAAPSRLDLKAPLPRTLMWLLGGSVPHGFLHEGLQLLAACWLAASFRVCM